MAWDKKYDGTFILFATGVENLYRLLARLTDDCLKDSFRVKNLLCFDTQSDTKASNLPPREGRRSFSCLPHGKFPKLSFLSFHTSAYACYQTFTHREITAFCIYR